jgi:hypothetical protein
VLTDAGHDLYGSILALLQRAAPTGPPTLGIDPALVRVSVE